MWLVTTIGFFSVVADSEPDTMMVRARVKADLEALKAEAMPSLSKIVFTKYRDYPYRAFIKRTEFEAGMAKLASMIDYTNFKDTVQSRQGWSRASLYTRVWSILIGLEVNKKRIEYYYAGEPLPKRKKESKAAQTARFNSILSSMDDNTRNTGTEG